MTRERLVRALAALALLLIAAGAFEPFYFRIYRMDRDGFRKSMAGLQYRKLPGSQRLWTGVRAWTKPGERIAVYPSPRGWNAGYEYLYLRSLYPLTGRTVVPLIAPDDRAIAGSLADVDAIAAWHAAPEVPGFAIVRRTEDGTLLRRVR